MENSGSIGPIGASIAESMPSLQTMTPGSSRWSGVSINDNWIDPNQVTNAFNAGGYEAALQDNMSIDGGGQNIPVKKILSTNPLERTLAMRAGHNVDYSGGTNNPTPSSALIKPGIMHLLKLLGGAAGGVGNFLPTPKFNPPEPRARMAGPMLDRPGTFGGSRRMF